ncbi:MAG: hypothetical protein LBV49_07530 [Azonexus sp.]|jgi:hypothetical protein|nr:hypothetical protein [Azonexus sp.]
MAQCLQLTTISGQQVVTLDPATPPSSCALLAINGSEYAGLLRGFIDSKADADAILLAFLVLFAIVFGFRMIYKAVDVGDPVSDEKH